MQPAEFYRFCDCVFYTQKTAYGVRISDWSSDVCSSESERLLDRELQCRFRLGGRRFLPVDDPQDEVDHRAIGRERQQYAAVHERRAAVVHELSLEADRRAVGDDP